MDFSAKPVSVSCTQMTEVVLPQHANVIGTAFGGTVLSWIDICAAITAQRHCARVAVTAAIDGVKFFTPLRVGDVVRLTGRINATFRTSLEIEVTVDREDPYSLSLTRCVDAYLTFVNVDSEGKPVPVPPLITETDEEKQREREAQKRRQQRLTHHV